VRALAFLVFAALYSSALLAAPQSKPTLLDLAEKKFAPRKLTQAEQKLFRATEKGEPTSALSSDDKQNDPITAADWPSERVIHAECLEWLCTNREAVESTTRHGIQVYGVRIDGDLDLEEARIPFPLLTWKCAFNGNVLLRSAHLRSLYLLNSSVKSLNAENAQIEGNVLFEDSFRAEGEVSFLGTKIGGTLNCAGAQLTNPKGKALNADRLNIAGYVFLRPGFKAEGEVNFLGATIGANLECDGAQLTNPEGKALYADGSKINGSVFLRDGFKAKGEVNFVIATIGGNLECQNAQITNAKGEALNAYGARINGSVFLTEGFKAEGEVNFLVATIGGNLNCQNAQLTNPEGKALYADGSKMDGSVFLRNGFKANGEVNLLGAKIGGALECDGAQLSNPKGKALNADRVNVGGYVFLRDGFKAQGEVNFLAATIGANLECDGAQLTNPEGKALYADESKINGSVFLRNGFNAEGEVTFLIATIGKNLECSRARLSNPNEYAFQADGAEIAGSVFLTDGFEADGGVGFTDSEVKGHLNWYKTRPAQNTWFDFRSAKVATLLDEESSWPVEARLFLDGFTYDRIDENSPVTAESRIRWLHRQPRDKFSPQPYEQLALVLRSMGHEREARAVMIEKNRDHARYLAEHGGRSRFLSNEWWWYNVLGRLIGYGYAPSRAFFISIGMILFGWWRFHRGFKKKLITPSDEKAYKKDSPEIFAGENDERVISDDYPKFNALLYSMESFIPLVKFDQSSNWMPNANRGKPRKLWRLRFTTGGMLRVYLWFHIMAGWVLTSLWVGAITGLVKS
jgi:hypothetical protein